MSIDEYLKSYRPLKAIYKTIAPTQYKMNITNKRIEHLDNLMNQNIEYFQKNKRTY